MDFLYMTLMTVVVSGRRHRGGPGGWAGVGENFLS